jgi:hypothetical protein
LRAHAGQQEAGPHDPGEHHGTDESQDIEPIFGSLSGTGML